MRIGGTGPPDFGQSTVAVTSRERLASVREGETLSNVENSLGPPLESFRVLRNGRTFKYLWFDRYTVLIVASEGQVISVRTVFM